jgi:hypothetical protein
MSKLNFSSVSEAFKLGSDQIRDTQKEIEKLKSIVMETTNNPSSSQGPSGYPGPSGYNRIGPPDTVSAHFSPPQGPPAPQGPQGPPGPPGSDIFDYTLMNLMKNPKFDDIVKNYVLIKHPEWLLSNTSYTPSVPVIPAPTPVTPTPTAPTPFTKESFGMVCDTVCSLVKFLVFSIVFYLIVRLLIKN